mgnify:CR=1 FL=1
MALPRRLYPKEFKINAVHLVQVEGRRACDVADELGIGRQTLYSWLHEARPVFCPEPPITPGKSLLSRPKLHD